MQFWLTEQQVQELTNRVRPSAQLRVLAAMGYSVRLRPDGTFVVPTDQFRADDKKPATYQLNFEGLGNGSKAA